MKSLTTLAISALILAACAPPQTKTTGKLDVVATIPPLAYLAEKIGGPEVAIEVLLQPGQEPHTFEAKPQHVERVMRSKLLIAIGLLPFESQLLDRIAAMEKSPHILQCAQGLPLRPFIEHEFEHAAHDAEENENNEENHHENDTHAKEPGDPHVWLGPQCMIQIAQSIEQALSAAAPSKAPQFQANLATLLEALRAQDNASKERLKPWQGRAVIVFHPAFGYFLDRYQLRQQAVEVGGKQPTPKQLRQLVQTAREQQVSTVFAQPQLDPRTARLVAEQIGGKVMPLDPMPTDPIANFAAMTQAIAESFPKTP